ncbi:MAG: DMT family transporter [Aeromonadaceae bacterium]
MFILRRHIGFILAILAATGFASKAIFAKLAYRYGVDAITLVTLRLGLALPILLLLRFFHMRDEKPLSWHTRGWLILLGLLGYYLSSLLDFLGLQSVSASVERMILCLYPTLTVLLSAWLTKSPITRHMVQALLLTYLGIGLVLAPDLVEGEADLWGVLLIVGSTITYALYLTWSPKIIRETGTMRFTELALLVSAAAMMIHFLMTRPLSVIATQPAEDWGYAAAMTLFSTLLPLYALSAAMAKIGASKTAIIATLGPILTIFMSAQLLDESLGALQWLGAAMVILGVWWIGQRRQG